MKNPISYIEHCAMVSAFGQERADEIKAAIAVTAELSSRHLATVLAALRGLQHFGFAPGADDIATDGGTLKPLTHEEIDGLCEVLNGSAPAQPVTLPADPSRDTLLALVAAVRELKDFGGDGGTHAEEAVESQLQAVEDAT